MDAQYSPIVDVGKNFVSICREAGQAVEDEMDWGQMYKYANDFFGEATGYPTVGMRRLAEGWMDEDTKHPVARKLGYGKYSMNE